MKKIKLNKFSIVSLICLSILVLLGLMYNVFFAEKIQDNVDISINDITNISKQEIRNYCNLHCKADSQMSKMVDDYSDYLAVSCNFFAKYLGTEKAIVNKAVITSKELSIVFNDSRYNICESPISLEKNDRYEFSICFFVEKNEYITKLSHDELMEYISSVLKIDLIST